MPGQQQLSAIFIFFTIVAIFRQGESKTDYCQTIAGTLSSGNPARLSPVLDCLKSFRYDAMRAKSITDTLYKTFDLHVYKDISKDSPTPEFPLKVDVLKGIKRIAGTVYQTDFDFNLALFKLINSLNDGHASYYTRCFFQNLLVETAFPLVSLYGSGKQTIKVTSDLDAFAGPVQSTTQKIMGVTIGNYAGATVVKINGIPAVDYAIKHSDTQGGFKDQNARYDALFSSPYLDNLLLKPGRLSSLPLLLAPLSNTVNLTVTRVGYTKSETLIVPYLVTWYGTAFRNASHYWKQFCEAPSTSRFSKPRYESRLMGKLPQPGIHFRKTKTAIRAFAETYSSATILVNSYVMTYLLKDTVTGVMVLPDFYGIDGDHVGWQADVYNGIFSLQSHGAKKLIIDVRDNPGGYALLADTLIDFLFPATVRPEYPIQNPATSFVQRMVRRSNSLMDKTHILFENPSQYNWFTKGRDSSAGFSEFKKSSSYFFPIVKRNHSSTTANYSSLYSFPDRLSPPYGDNLLLLPNAHKIPFFPPSRMLILSNGGCYSTCALFAYKAQEIIGVKIAAVGGIGKKPMAYAAGAVGYSYDLETLLKNDVNYLGLTSDKDAPEALPIQAVVGFVGAQAFCRKNKSIPADFVFKKADHRIPFTTKNVGDAFQLYVEASNLF